MRITLNLATRPFYDLGPATKRLRIAMGVLAVLAIALGLGLRSFHKEAEEARARDHSLDSDLARVTLERQGYQDRMKQPANAQLMKHAESLNKLFDEKAFSWTLAMEDLENVLPGGVQVSTLEPVRAKDGHITLHLRVIGPRDRAVELVRNLEHSRRFLLPRIAGENSESTGGPGEQMQPVSASNRVNFDVLADYNPAALGEHATARAADSTVRKTDRASMMVAVAHPDARPAQRPRPPYTGKALPGVNRNKPQTGPNLKPNPGATR
jgi:type IV pilus assembly protein PilN